MAATSNVLTDAEIEAIIAPVAGGFTLSQSCKKAKRDYINVNKRINASPELKRLYAHAREEYARLRVQQMDEIARDLKMDVQRARLLCDNIKWETARVLPKEFGDRVQQEVIINDNRTLSTRMSQARNRARRQVDDAVVSQIPAINEKPEAEEND